MSCNSESGSVWDSELARQLNPLSLYLGIRRQRGSVPSEVFPTSTGGGVQVHADGTMTIAKPEVEETTDGVTTRIHISARNRRELRRLIQGYRRKYPQLSSRDLEEFMSLARDSSSYSLDPIGIDVSIGGVNAGRSLVKSAVALVFDAGVDPGQCALALDYLLNEGAEPCFGYYYERGHDLVANRPAKLPFHCVHVEGCSSDSTLLGYIELYGLWRMVLCLSETYSGPDFSHTYSIDPVKGKEMHISVNMDLSVSDVREAYEYKRYDEATFQQVTFDVFDTVREINFNRALEHVVNNATSTAFANSGAKEGDILTDEQTKRLFRDIAAKLAPFLAHNLSRSVFLENDGDD